MPTPLANNHNALSHIPAIVHDFVTDEAYVAELWQRFNTENPGNSEAILTIRNAIRQGSIDPGTAFVLGVVAYEAIADRLKTAEQLQALVEDRQ